MSEKVRSLNLTTGNLHTPTTTQLIGAPTLISSTFSGNSHHHPAQLLHQQQQQQHHHLHANQTLTPTAASLNVAHGGGGIGGVGDIISPNATTASDTESSTDFTAAAGTITTQLNFQLLSDIGLSDCNSIMNTSQISATSNDSSIQLSQSPAAASGGGALAKHSVNNGKHLAAQSVAGKSCRFPKLEECAHFHYERVQLGPLSVQLLDDKSEQLTSSIASQSIGGDIANTQPILNVGGFGGGGVLGPASLRSFSPTSCSFIIKVFPYRCEPFLVKRSYENMQMLDEMLHRCVYDRKISGLINLQELEFKSEEDVEYAVAKYLERFSKIASDSLTCGTILTWFQLDNKGRRLPLADGDTQRTINTPAVGAAYGVRRYQAQASDEISIEVGDMISVIDMPSPAESIWWRGKKSHLQKSHYEVGFFPQSCVATIGDKVPRNFPMPAPLVGQLDVSPTKPVLRKHGKLIAFFRSFILSRPSRRRLKQSGIYRERVFSCDLSEHLLNSGQEIPMVLKSCAEFIENHGIIDGIYRLSGITSNIQRLRRSFDEERVPDLGNPEMKQDIHAVSSLLKMYFRELPNPLCTYQLYDNFVEAIQAKSESNERLRLMKETVLKLPPPHYRTLKYLSEHLNRISQHHERTGMTDKNLAIVWAPNLLRSPALESGGVAALRGVGVQAVVTEYLIRNCHSIFDALDDCNARLSFIATAGAAPAITNDSRMDSLTDCESLLVEQREHDQSLTNFVVERPKSLSAGGPKLISLEEAQERHSRLDGFDMKQSMPISMVSSNAANIGSYIEVGGGPSSLPDKYHTVLAVPRSWQKRKTHSWKSLFTRNQQRPVSNGGTPNELKASGNDDGTTTPHHKEATQVTFAETDAIIMQSSCKNGLHKQDKPKSIEMFETTRSDSINSKPMELCMRSNSIDSLRTAAGHSRSVSHDSYFDLLQSPQRGHMTTCPSSRELSELGLNFDREEPEMRIFSESESLVSSPRVGKENIPPSSGATSRRIMRARPEEFSSQTNSVNPSPKKQPRLNLLFSPGKATTAGTLNNWSHAQSSAGDIGDVCAEHAHHLSSDESCCKRYKLEDQLSDIQFIDCGTPEHTHSQPQTMYTSVQVHAPPKSALSKSSLYTSSESAAKLQDVVLPIGCATRYSYPSVQLGAKRKEQNDSSPSTLKERFSYPGSGISTARSNTKEVSKSQIEQEMEAVINATSNPRTVSFSGSTAAPNIQKSPAKPMSHLAKALPELLRPKNRNSYCGTNEQFNRLLLRSNSGDITKDAKYVTDMERSKLSVTPSTPMQSPRYSLLMGDTSSENSSALNTPQYELEPLMVNSAMSGMSALSGASSTNQQQQQHTFMCAADAGSSYLGTSHESLGSNFTTNSNEKRDMNALKRELSLDLQPISTKMSIDHTDAATRAATLPPKHQQQLIPSPNNSNQTDNTSQSVTPSEYGYQHLQRQLSMHSLIETEENSPVYDDYENTPSNLISPLAGVNTATSPIKSTISITYNLKSPTKESTTPTKTAAPLLETSFDEHTVYEQVKLFRNSVTEVNQLLNEKRQSLVSLAEELKEDDEEELSTDETSIEDMSHIKATEMSNELLALETRVQHLVHDDEQMVGGGRNAELNAIDSLETQNISDDVAVDNNDFENDKLLYENVELRKPKSIYENLLGENMKCGINENRLSDKFLNDKIDLDSLESNKSTDDETTEKSSIQEQTNRKSPSNFSVKELANKFESSPVEQMPAFDFGLRASLKKQKQPQQQLHNDSKVNESTTNKKTMNQSTQLNKTQQQITRSLDENAFVREFGAKQLADLNVRSSQQLTDLATDLSNRRKSFDFTRPKTLNPPKRLPGMPITEEICQQRNEKAIIYCEQFETKTYAHKITPTTENRISLIQNNVQMPPIAGTTSTASTAADLNNSNNVNVVKGVLSGVKLDRERIDRIKEERRQQLTQKYHTETFKTRSKTDLHTTTIRDDELAVAAGVGDKKFHAESSLRVKSKSRGDMHTLQKDMDNIKQFGRAPIASLHAGSESTLNAPLYTTTQRIRSISDEKNQNCDTTTNNTNTTSTNTNSTSITTAQPTTISVVATATRAATTPFVNNSNANSYAAHNKVADLPNNKTQQTTPEYEEYSARATVQKFERKTFDFANGSIGSGNSLARERAAGGNRDATTLVNNAIGNNGASLLSASRNSLASTRDKISPQFSIRDVTAMFESRSQNQQ